jgi:hypothetical protein
MLLALVPDPFEVVGLFFAIGTTMLALYAGFVGVRWFHRKADASPSPSLDSGQHEALLDRVARLEEVEARMAELEERVDFSERLLAQVKSDGALPRGEER